MSELKSIRCPKCRRTGDLVCITEVYSSILEFDVKNNFAAETGNIRSGDFLELRVICQCGHEWSPRRFGQKSDLEL